METRRSFAGETLDDQTGAHAFEQIDEKIDILVYLPKPVPFWTSGIIGRHGRISKNLQLMELHRIERKRVDRLDLIEHHLRGFVGQSENEMSAGTDSPFGRHFERPSRTSEIVSPIRCVP